MSNGESTVSQASINARAEALEKKEAEEAAKKGGATGEEGGEGGDADAAAKAKADKEAADKAAADKAEADKKAAEEAEKNGQEKDPKTGKFVSKKREPNDPEEMRKWSTRVSQENSKLRKEMSDLKEAQEKTYKLLASLSKNPTVDYKELAKKDPEALAKFIEEEKDAMTAEFQEQIDQLAVQVKERETAMERMRRERDTENYPHWNRLYPDIVKLAMGPTGQGDPRVDFTKRPTEVLDQLYELALQANPGEAAPAKPAATADSGEKVYKESEMKAMLQDMLSKEREAIAKTAREQAIKEAQEALRAEATGGTVASTGRGSGRVPTDQLAAFKKMSLAEQKEWLIANSPNQQ